MIEEGDGDITLQTTPPTAQPMCGGKGRSQTSPWRWASRSSLCWLEQNKPRRFHSVLFYPAGVLTSCNHAASLTADRALSSSAAARARVVRTMLVSQMLLLAAQPPVVPHGGVVADGRFVAGALDDVAPDDLLARIEAILPALREQMDGDSEAVAKTLWHDLRKKNNEHDYAPIGTLIERLSTLEPFKSLPVVGAEFWTQIRKPDNPLFLHLDTSETLKASNFTVSFPIMSTILYLGDRGGPTIVFNNSISGCSREAAATLCPRLMQKTELDNGGRLVTGALISPIRGRLGFFDGGLLHGVLPTNPSMQPREVDASPRADSTAGSAAGSEAPGDGLGTERQTLLMNFWGLDPGIANPRPPPLMRQNVAARGATGDDEKSDDHAHAAIGTDRRATQARYQQPLQVGVGSLCDVVRLEVRLPLDVGDTVGVVYVPVARLGEGTGAVLAFDTTGHPMSARIGEITPAPRTDEEGVDVGYASFRHHAKNCAGVY